MRKLFQRCQSDCVPTCLAMIADLTYSQAVKLLHPNHQKGQPYTTHINDLVNILDDLGFVLNVRRKVGKFSSLKKPSLIFIKGASFAHVSVWDPELQVILEPAKHLQCLTEKIYLSRLVLVLEVSK